MGVDAGETDQDNLLANAGASDDLAGSPGGAEPEVQAGVTGCACTGPIEDNPYCGCKMRTFEHNGVRDYKALARELQAERDAMHRVLCDARTVMETAVKGIMQEKPVGSILKHAIRLRTAIQKPIYELIQDVRDLNGKPDTFIGDLT